MEQKQLIITGASSGIGESTANIFLSNGWDVLNISRNPCTIDGVENISLDFSDSEFSVTLKQKLETTGLHQKHICVVHNTAYCPKDSTQNNSTTELRKAVEVNLIAPTIINQLIIPYMVSGSSIIYMGSTLSEKAVANSFTYSTTKHASVGMMRATTQDLANTGIHSACVCPGFTDTDMLRKHLNNDSELISKITDLVCFDRLIDPSEIANLIYFAATNPVINGSVLHANLGQIEN